jgi:hypothetical protein
LPLICPSCRGPLPEIRDGGGAGLACPRCSAEIDLSRAGTAAGRPRFVPELDRSGQLVGGFRVGVRIGAGGMGTVYRGLPADGDTAAAATGAPPVAIKFLTPALAGEPEVVARFEREVRLMRALDHPGIVRVLDQGSADGVPWFAMELVEGRDLKARLRDRPLAPAEVAALFSTVLDALAHAHGRGVVHRDIKPGNVLLHGESAKLADFGVALPAADVAGPAAVTRLTETAAVIGTLPYMSPEQRAGAAVDRRSDLFSVGVMLYEAATGRLPQGAFPPASQMNRAFQPAFDRVVSRLLQPDPDARFADAAQAARALATALAPPRARRRLIRASAAAAALTALAAAAGLGGPRLAQLRADARATDAAAKVAPKVATKIATKIASLVPVAPLGPPPPTKAAPPVMLTGSKSAFRAKAEVELDPDALSSFGLMRKRVKKVKTAPSLKPAPMKSLGSITK